MATHPYFPEDLELPGYKPIDIDYTTILAVFFTGTAIISAVLLFVAKWSKLKFSESLVVCWLGFSGITHMVVEGPVVVHAEFFRDHSTSPFISFMNNLWKEYGKADSRYLTRDGCTIGIEGITAFVEGPLCMLCILGYMRRSSWRQILTVLIVTGELYGTVLYFYTSFHDGFAYQRPEPLYWWFYFWCMNGIWIVCPTLIIINLSRQICSAIGYADRKKRA
ncbi:hypothetical protein BSKO_01215 [Bryopsis sp. KO-2023]|nr:hypothetical protein BSKO_01215 [Bryopsis sp. KO-2023]